MKKCVILVAMMFSGILVAQEVKPELEAVGSKVKATYYYEMEEYNKKVSIKTVN